MELKQNQAPTKANYHGIEMNRLYMGSSQYKAFERCEAYGLATVTGEYVRGETTALLVGSYVDSYFSDEFEEFKAGHENIFTKSGTLKAEYQKADEIIARIERDKAFMEHLQGRKQAIMTGEIAGVLFKIKPDFLQDDKIVDLKIVRDFESLWSPLYEERVPFVEAWGYDVQAAIYQEIVRQNTGRRNPFIIAAATKERVPDIALLEVPQARLDYCMDRVMYLAPRFSEIKLGLREAQRCEKCEWCRETKVLTGPVDYLEVTA